MSFEFVKIPDTSSLNLPALFLILPLVAFVLHPAPSQEPLSAIQVLLKMRLWQHQFDMVWLEALQPLGFQIHRLFPIVL